MIKTDNMTGITLISLIITVIVLLILAVVAINLTIGDNGILKKSEQSIGIHNKEEATEKMNMKITSSQMHTYTKEQRMPTLQELADALCEDKEMEYVVLESKAVASIDKVIVGDKKSIFTKIKKYPYEFEINSSLQLASIDGVKIATNETVTIDKAEYEQLKNSIEELKEKMQNMENTQYQKLRSDNYEEVNFIDGQNFIAPCDGYYCFSSKVISATDSIFAYVIHYTSDGTLIAQSPAAGYSWGMSGSEIYMQKGEYIRFVKQKNGNVIDSKFFYAVGCQPDKN